MGGCKMYEYYIGTPAIFESWETWVCDKMRANIPPEGRINFVNGIPSPNNQRTMRYTIRIDHPTIRGKCIWNFCDYDTLNLPKISYDEAVAEGYFPNN